MRWRFWQGSEPGPVPARVRAALARERGLSAEGAASLRMVTGRGANGDRPVTHFAVIDPAIVPLTGVSRWDYRSLDPRPIVYAGHFERDGSVVLDPKPRPPEPERG